nr:Vps52 Sac2 domain containing protein [Haemonchus contortus]
MSIRKDKSTNSLKAVEDCLAELATADENIVREALSAGNDLNNISVKVNEELTEAHRIAVKECIQNADKLTDLHNQILACDQVFERLEKMLLGFQGDLGTISEDMKRLQDQSISINQELENRQKVRGELSQFVDDIIVPQTMIKVIMEADVNDRAFLEQLHELQHKINFIKAQESKDARSVYDVLGVLESLKFKAIEKIREWILAKIYMFRKPLSNYQVPQHQLLKSRFFYEFLAANESNIAQEFRESVQDEYIDTVSKMFFSYFKVYITRLFKLMMSDAASKDDLLGAEDVVKSGGISGLFAGKPHHRNRATVFSLGSRQEILTHDFLNPLIVPHAAQEANQKFQFEALFRSIHLAFVDHCSHEFLFLTDFFMVSGQTAIDLHAKVMGRAMAHLVRAFDERIAVNFDCISLHLCICLCDKFHRLLTEREIPSMSGYWEAISNQLWTRLAQVMQMHNDSVKALDVKRMQTPIDTRPHYIVRRYAELTCAFLVVTESSGRELGPKMEAILESCEDAVEQLLLRMSACLPNARDRLVFLINNYDLTLGIIDERVVQDSRIHSIIHELEQKAIGEFVEATLQPHFSSLLSFVSECEPLVQQGHTHLLVRYNDKLTAVVQTFSANWRRSIDAINGEVVKSFTNFKNGTNILQAVFTQLVQYVQRFSKLVSHEIFRDNPARNDMVNIHHILVELKKYKPVY